MRKKIKQQQFLKLNIFTTAIHFHNVQIKNYNVFFSTSRLSSGDFPNIKFIFHPCMTKRLNKSYFLLVPNKSFDRVEGGPKQNQFYEWNCWKPCPYHCCSSIAFLSKHPTLWKVPDFILSFLRQNVTPNLTAFFK